MNTSDMIARLRRVARASARAAVNPIRRRLTMRPERLQGRLAVEGGKPVRHKFLRPWPSYPDMTRSDWNEVRPTFERLFRTGQEGLPQELSQEFARRWAEYLGARHALLLPHGTDALRVALASALDHDGVEYGGEVIVPNLSFIASSTSALDRRLGVALVDVDPDTLLLDPVRVEEAIVPGRTRAIMAVHLFGQPADMRALQEIARRHSLKVIEDAAQAHGAIHELGRAGTLGDAAGFSFQSSKNLSAGEGGAFTTNDPEIFERAYAFHNVGRKRVGGQRWGHDRLGWNLRPSEYVAAVLLHRLNTLEQEQRTRAARYDTFRRELAGVACVRPLAFGPGVVRHGVHMGVVRYEPEACGGLTISDFQRALAAEGIPIAPLYNGITQAEQPGLREIADRHPDYVRVLPTPVADRAVREILFVPHHVFLGTDEEMKELVAAFAKVEKRYGGAAGAAGSRSATIAPADSEQRREPVSGGNGAGRPTSPRRTLRAGIVGMGVMGRHHADAIRAHPGVELIGVSDQSAEAGRAAADEYGVRAYRSAEQLIASGQIDTLVVATPHWHHPETVVPALEAGLHVICEKPLAVTVAEADRVLAAAERASGQFAVVFQNRLEPAYQYVKKLLSSGELGAIRRCYMVETTWRSGAYYGGSEWRGTWKGEGGGVLINQAPHVLDRYAWLCGMPETVLGLCDTVLHRIEVEDTASVILRHADGMHGQIHVSTTEAPGEARTVISCDRGRIVVEEGRVLVTRLSKSIREETEQTARTAGTIPGATREVRLSHIGGIAGLLQLFYDDFSAAVAEGRAPACPGEEGIQAVELANAIHLSSDEGRAVFLPLDRRAHTEWLEQKRAGAAANTAAVEAGGA